MSEPDDLARLRNEYSDRNKRLAGRDLYSPFNKANLFILQQRQRFVLAALRKAGFYPLNHVRVLEIGCGSGGVLLEFLSFDATPSCLVGVDLLPDRLREAHRKLPHLSLACANGQHLSFPSETFDLILQYTTFSSLLDDSLKAQIARDMLRVLKPSGMILWYDFWLNPTNSQTRGIRPKEISRLFPGCRYKFQRITLAPPIARRIVPISWTLAALLEKLKVFNSHFLVSIKPI